MARSTRIDTDVDEPPTQEPSLSRGGSQDGNDSDVAGEEETTEPGEGGSAQFAEPPQDGASGQAAPGPAASGGEAGTFAAAIERMMAMQLNHQAAQQAAQAEQISQLMNQVTSLQDKNDGGSSGKSSRHYGPDKLRLDGCPRWPPGKREAANPFYMFAESFIVYMGLLGYGSVLEADPSDLSVSSSDDSIVLRYICAAINSSTISSYLAMQFMGKGREAWKYLQTKFGVSYRRYTLVQTLQLHWTFQF